MDLCRDKVGVVIELSDEMGDDLLIFGVDGVGEQVMLLMSCHALADFQDEAAGFMVITGNADNIAIHVAFDQPRPAFGGRAQRADGISQARGFFVVHSLRGVVHLPL